MTNCIICGGQGCLACINAQYTLNQASANQATQQCKQSIFLTVSVTSFKKLVEAGFTVSMNNDHLVVRLETEKYSFTFSQDA